MVTRTPFITAFAAAVALLGCESGTLSNVGDRFELIDSGFPSTDLGTPPSDAGVLGTDAQPTGPVDAGPSCTPSCGGRECGSDGCGGSCGSCGAGSTCSAGSCTPTTTEGCPPAGPFGAGEGQIATNITLYECDGTPIELHSLCSRRVSYVYTFAEWCPNCRTFLREQMEDEHMAWSAMGELETWVVVTAVSGGGSVDQAACARIRDSYGIDTPGMRVLYDPEGVTNSVLGMRVNTADMVMKRGNEIVGNGPWAWITVENFLAEAFAETSP